MTNIPDSTDEEPRREWFPLAFEAVAFFYAPVVAVDGWQWFVVPLGVPAILYWQAMGLRFLRRVFGTISRPVPSEHSVMESIGLCVGLGMVHFVMWAVS